MKFFGHEKKVVLKDENPIGFDILSFRNETQF